MEFSQKQKEVIRKITTGDDYFTLLSGAIRSGKSYIAALSFLIYTQSIGGSRVNIIAGRNLRIMEVELIPTLEDFCKKLGAEFSYSRSTGLITINSVKYLVVAGHDENSYKRVQSLTAGAALIDEIQLVPESFVIQIMARLTYKNSKIVSTCNPEGPKHWLKVDYIDTKKVNYLRNFNLTDNLTVEKEVRDRYKELFTGVFYERNILGKWVQSEGVIYKSYLVDKVRIEKSNVLYEDIGVDYGIKSITAYQRLTYLRDGRCIISSTYRYSGEDRIKTDQELVNALLDFIGNSKIQRVYIDPSASSFIAELRKRRRNFGIIEADNSVLPGIKTVLNGFNSNKLIVQDNEENQPLMDELDSYSWDKGDDDKPIKENDHHCDAVRYAYYNRNKNQAQRPVRLPKGL